MLVLESIGLPILSRLAQQHGFASATISIALRPGGKSILRSSRNAFRDLSAAVRKLMLKCRPMHSESLQRTFCYGPYSKTVAFRMLKLRLSCTQRMAGRKIHHLPSFVHP